MTDKLYEVDRNRLIPLACSKADIEVGCVKSKTGLAQDWRNQWDQVYFREMDRLARLHGVVR
jgi:hypothetical protein